MATGDESKPNPEPPPVSLIAKRSDQPAAKEAPAPKDKWDKLQAFSPLFTGVVLAVIGYILTGSVDLVIQKSQLDFNYVKEMQELLSKLGEPDTTQEQAKTLAVALASFGSRSVAPLLNEIQSPDLNRQMAGEYGLRAVALANPDAACPEITRVIANRTAAYTWITHRAIIRILGRANCQKSRVALMNYASRLDKAHSPDGFTVFQETLAEEPTVTRESVDLIKSDIERSLKLLKQGEIQD